MDMRKHYVSLMLDFMLEAGKLALEHLHNSEPKLKEDGSVITKADEMVTRLARERLSDDLKIPGHILIDEESPDRSRYLDRDLLEGTPFIWSLDPVDGTRLYANRIPLFGISLGLIKDLRPWLGAVYFPALKELFYCDGEQSVFVQDAFGDKEKLRLIRPLDVEIDSRSLFLCSDSFFQYFQWDYKDCHFIIPACAAVDLCWPVIGRACGSLLRSNIWDFAGAWPVVRAAGMDLRSLKDGRILDHIDLTLFDRTSNPWKLNAFYLLSSERNFPLLREKILPLPKKHIHS